MKKLIILLIVLLTTLSATLLDTFSEPVIKEKLVNPVTGNTFEKDIDVAKKLKLFNVNEYLKEYEHKKKAKGMMIEVMQEK